jgi:proton glutamate symport protein
MLNKYRSWQLYVTLIMIIMSFICGIFMPQVFNYCDFIGIIFINLLKLCAIPIIVSSLILTIANFNKFKQFGNIVITVIFYILLSEIIAVTIGMLIFNHVNFRSLANNSLFMSSIISTTTSMKNNYNSHDIVNYLFTDNLFKSLTNFEILPLVIFAIMFGLIIANNKNNYTNIINILTEIKNSFNQLLQIVILFSPLAIFVLIGEAVSTSYQDGLLITNIVLLGKFILFFILGLIIHFTWQFMVIVFSNKYSVKNTIKNLQSPAILAFITSSSLATMATAIKSSIKSGSDENVTEFMLPITCSMNFASGMMYEMVACLFFMQLLNIDISISKQIILAITCIITGIAVGGIPETSMVSFITIFTLANIPLGAIAILLPLDRIIDRIRTMVNISCNILGSLIVTMVINRNHK